MGNAPTKRAWFQSGPLRRHKFTFLAAAFLLFFLATSSLFWFVEHDHPAQADNLKTPLDVLYWWLITCTTVGYGDISPKTQAGKLLVILTVIVGVSMATAAVTRIGSFFFEKRLRSMRGLGRMDHLSDHIVVCGWQDDLAAILQSLLELHPVVQPGQIVLVNAIDPDRINPLRSRPEFRGLEFVSGDFTVLSDLERAGVGRARSILILADQGEASPDAKTLLGIMAVRQINKAVHLCAEAQEERFVPYLLEAGCDEVIHLASLRVSLVAQMLHSPGISNIFHHLLSLGQGALIELEAIPQRYVGKTFADLQQSYQAQPGALLVGLLENVGNPYEMKREALRNAQKTPDMSQLVSQLQEVKQMLPHTPFLCPPPDRPIRPRTHAVVLRRSRQEGPR